MSIDAERTVPTGALATALETTELLAGHDQDADTTQWAQSLRQAIEIWGLATITDAYGLIISAAMQGIEAKPDSDDRLHTVVPAMVNRFHHMQLPEVPDADLPLVTGLLTAARFDLNLYDWRLRLGPIRPGEVLVWCYVAWLLIDLVDQAVYQQPGLFANILREVLLTGPDGDE